MGQLTNLYVSESYQGLLKLANSTTGVTGTLQYVQDGLGNNIPMLVSTSSVVITGSFRGDGSGLTGITATVDSGSLVTTASFNAYTSSNDNRVNSLIASTGSYATTSSLTALSQSIASTDLAQNNRLNSIEGKTGSYATTGSNNFVGQQNINGSVNVTGSLNVTGEITALSASITYLQTIYQTSSIVFSSGSNILGDEAGDTQTLWGTVKLPTGPLVVTGSVTSTGGFNGNLNGTASYATNALSASHSINADTASFLLGTVASASYAVNADTASIANDLIVRGKNNNASTLTRGTIVRIVGANGDNPLIDSASWTDDLNSANTLGMLSEDVVTNGFANVVVQGKVIGINTNGMAAGSLLFLSSSGQYTTSSVPAPYHEVRLGQVLRDNTNNGSAYITIDNGYELTELHDVDITNPVNGNLLIYRSGSYGIWQNESASQIGLATTSSVNQKLDTGSFNTYTASMDARTGSYITTGSISTTQAITGSVIISGSQQIIIGNVDLSGSMNIRNGNFEVISNNTTLNPDFYLTSSQAGQSNMVFGWGDNPTAGGAGTLQANYTGSLRITGSNNIVNLPQLRATNYGLGTDSQGYISGSNNWINSNAAGIFLNTGSLLFPKTQGNIVGPNSAIGMVFTTSSLSGGHPAVNNNFVMSGQIILNHPSGSPQGVSNNGILGGSIFSTQNFVTNTRPTISSNNVIGGVTLNHISSSINYQNNYNNSPVTINNHLSSSGIANNSFTFSNNSVFGGSSNTGLGVWVSGSQSSNATRQVIDNLIGGKNIVVSSSFVSSSASNLNASLVYGQGLGIIGNHSGNVGGTAILGRFNDTGSLGIAQDIVFAVGTGTAAATRRTGLYVTSGSLVGVSGSFDVKGNSTLTGSVNILGETVMSSSLAAGVPLYVSGTIQTQRMQYDGNPFNSNPSSNLAALRYDSNNQAFSITNYNKADLSSGSIVELFINTGSNFVHTKQFANYANTSAVTTLSNSNGVRNFDVNTDTTTITGSLRVTGSAIITGSVQGNVIPLTVASNTASLNLNNGNFFELALTGSQDIRIEPSNIKPGQTINIKLNTTGSGTVSFPTSVKQVSGSAYVPTSGTSTDIITMVSFDSTNLFLANVKNLI